MAVRSKSHSMKLSPATMSPRQRRLTAPERPALRMISAFFSRMRLDAAKAALTLPIPLSTAIIRRSSKLNERQFLEKKVSFTAPKLSAAFSKGLYSISSAKIIPTVFFILIFLFQKHLFVPHFSVFFLSAELFHYITFFPPLSTEKNMHKIK